VGTSRNQPEPAPSDTRASTQNRPLAEQLWHAHIAENDGQFPALEALTDGEVKTLQRVLAATPANVGRRVVSDWNGNAIWFRKTKSGLRWYTVRWEQDQRLRGL
jgi:hypothetical protein